MGRCRIRKGGKKEGSNWLLFSLSCMAEWLNWVSVISCSDTSDLHADCQGCSATEIGIDITQLSRAISKCAFPLHPLAAAAAERTAPFIQTQIEVITGKFYDHIMRASSAPVQHSSTAAEVVRRENHLFKEGRKEGRGRKKKRSSASSFFSRHPFRSGVWE